jgi:DNA-binding response OmpR family regulator
MERIVLVVEDNPEISTIYNLVFQKGGFSVQPALNGASALRYLASVSPDLVILDIYLPDMSGLDILTSIRKSEEDSHIPVIIVTGDHYINRKPEAAQADMVLVKPVQPFDILALGEAVIRRTAAYYPRNRSTAS